MRYRTAAGTEAWLADISARATPLWDRRMVVGHSRSSARRHVLAARRWKRWQTVLGSHDILASRLANAGIERESLDPLLAGEQRAQATRTWVSTFRSIFVDSGGGTAPHQLRDRATDGDAPLPFEDLLVGAVRHARNEVIARSPSVSAVLEPTAAAMLERQLLAHLTFVASEVLGQDFYDFRFRQAPLAVFEDAFCNQPQTTVIYDAYVEAMQRGGLARTFDRYPVLARLIAQAVEDWIVNTSQLCERYLADRADLEALLQEDLRTPGGSIVEARANLSDRHDSGTTVVALRLRNGQHLVYKPRSGSGELGWQAVLAWLSRRSAGCTLVPAQVLDRGPYHWTTWVAADACTTEESVRKFYSRCGITLAVLHVLAATDVHSENLIARGDHPIVVDLEMLLNAGPIGEGEADALVRTGMLPNWQTTAEGHRFDLSALGADYDQAPGVAIPRWRNINTDQMMRVVATAGGPGMDHRVQLRDMWPNALEYMDVLLEGFAAAYRCFLAGRDELTADLDICAALAGLELRVLLRETNTYARLILHLRQPDLLRDGLDRSIELEWLARPLSVKVSAPAARLAIYDMERRALENQDIPRFTTPVWNSLAFSDEDQEIAALGRLRTPETFFQRLETLSEADLREHLAAIMKAVRQRFDGEPDEPGSSRRSEPQRAARELIPSPRALSP